MELFKTRENTRIYNSRYGWQGETFLEANGKKWVISTMKRNSGKISTHCTTVEGGEVKNGMQVISYGLLMGKPKNEDFHLNTFEGRATENTIKEAHYKALAEFDALRERGALPQAEKEYQIEVGQILFTHMTQYENRRAVYEIQNTSFGPKYKTVLLDGSRFYTDEYVRNFKDKFGIGTYFIEGETIPVEELANLQIKAAESERAQAVLNDIATQQRKEEEAKKAEYLSQFKRADVRTTTAIIKRHILKTWPEVISVSVNTESFSGGSSMRVKYQAPEEIEALETFINSFQYGRFNGMEDIYEYREMDEIILEGHILNTYKYCSSLFEKCEPRPAKVDRQEPVEGLELVNYSEKAVALFGDTKPIKDKLKQLGGRFNPFLTHNGGRVAGWIFPKTQEDNLRGLIG